MRIGLLIDDSLDRPDGVQQFVLTLGQWLTEQGHTVHYLTSQTKRTDLAGIHVLAGSWSVKFNGNQLNIPRLVSKKTVSDLLDELDLDVIHVQMPYSPLLAGRVIKQAHQRGILIVSTYHILPYGILARHSTRLLGLLQRNSMKRIGIYTATSLPAKEFALWSHGIDCEVVPNLVNLALFRGALDPKAKLQHNSKKRIVFLGRLVPRKGAKQLVIAIAKLPKSLDRDNLEVIIAGKGPLQHELQQIIYSQQLEDIVSLIGFVSETDKPGLLNSADIAVFPSISGESFGIVLVEAMAAGAGVVVGGDNPGYRSVLGRWEDTLFDPKDSTKFASCLERIIGDPELREKLHAGQQSSVKQYDIDIVGRKFLSVYQRLKRDQAE